MKEAPFKKKKKKKAEEEKESLSLKAGNKTMIEVIKVEKTHVQYFSTVTVTCSRRSIDRQSSCQIQVSGTSRCR